MNDCSTCGKQLDESSKFCSACGAIQPSMLLQRTEKLPAIVVTLAILTLLGSAFGIIRGFFYQTFATWFESTSLYNENYSRGYILVVLNLGTSIAAILMLNLKRSGFYLYLFFQSAYLVFTFYVMFIYSSYQDTTVSNLHNGLNPLVVLVGSFFWFPSAILLVLYLSLARRYFRKPSSGF